MYISLHLTYFLTLVHLVHASPCAFNNVKYSIIIPNIPVIKRGIVYIYIIQYNQSEKKVFFFYLKYELGATL